MSLILFPYDGPNVFGSDDGLIATYLWQEKGLSRYFLFTMYVRKKHNRSGSTSVAVVSKASGKYIEIKSGSSEIWSDA